MTDVTADEALAKIRQDARTHEETPVRRGFPSLSCPLCGGDPSDTTISVALQNVSTFYCSSCRTEFTKENVLERINPWLDVFQWLDTAPAVEE